ncbi:16S rRNA (cytosine1402-N4)-methyltransferase [Thermotomaculum hydrothermale]|uniref:Ribosomal RNA small subunit methyltransferase H n=1 Tax=Thermotomaculum hydrothermale TaxID=981385 RepID=A0A7R6SYP9_9BACT|nr:16S rRNA (cytosine(1402)-N(4))-methyltransferase RsmH [Thermotomaculum hydrothermale]BBB32806.1 16S rRNA (cytosine1402-N4)-methyltransferase [Thermotomaculum hydrothermale]
MHTPVLLSESIEFLNVKPEGIYFDCTSGGGGHSEEIAKRLSEKGMLICLDMDEDAIERVRERLKSYKCNKFFFHKNFKDIDEVANEVGIAGEVDGILADLGTSMFQLKDFERGFSFSGEGELDMRMNRKSNLTAEEVVNRYSENELALIFKEYGEERLSKKIARMIVEERKISPIKTTSRLAEIAVKAYGSRKSRIHPATRIFQAIRIEVNKELENLKIFLEKSIPLLKKGGRLVVISFHSLEDRIVKNFFRDKAKNCICPEFQMRCTCGGNNAIVKVLTKKVIRPSEVEVGENPASRSARLRACEKVI